MEILNELWTCWQYLKVGIIDEIILIPALSSSEVITHKGKPLNAAEVDICNLLQCANREKPAESADSGQLQLTEQDKRVPLLKLIERNTHGVIDGSQHLDHELWV